MRYDLTDREDEVRDERVLTILRAYNREQAVAFFALRDDPAHAPVPLHVYAVDDDGVGIGRELLARAEAVGRERGCRHAFLDTMSYQAPEFYERCGWQQTGELPDWDSHGHSKFFYVRRLA